MPISPDAPPNRWAPHPCTLRQLQYLVAVAELLSFRRAAEACRVSQPSLSAQVAAAEGALGVRVFERDRRHVLLTGAGREVIERARACLRAAADLTGSAARLVDPFAGTQRIGIIPTISPYLLPRCAPRVRQAFPQAQVRWIEDKTPSLVAQLAAGELEGAVLALEAELGDVDHEVIASDPFVLAAAPGHRLAAGKRPVPLGELRGESVLLLEEGHCFRTQVLELCNRAHADEMSFRATSLPTLTQMVAAGAGVTLLPALAVPTEAERADLRLRRFRAPAPHRTIAMVWRKRSVAAEPMRAIARVIRAGYPRA